MSNIDLNGYTWINVGLDVLGIALSIAGIWWVAPMFIAAAVIAVAEFSYDVWLYDHHRLDERGLLMDAIFTIKEIVPWAWITYGTIGTALDIAEQKHWVR